MTEEEKEEFLEISKRIGYKIGTYCNEEEIRIFEKILEDYKYKNNLIQLQQKELEKKDKIIDLLTKFVENNISEKKLINEICIKGKCVNEECHEDDIKECVKQYFEKQVEKE